MKKIIMSTTLRIHNKIYKSGTRIILYKIQFKKIFYNSFSWFHVYKFGLTSVTSSMIASDVVIVYKIKSNHVKCLDLQNLFPIHNPNYVLRNRLPFYPDLPSSRHSEANPIFRLSRCYNDLSQKLENPLDFSLNVSKVAVLFKMLTLVYK